MIYLTLILLQWILLTINEENRLKKKVNELQVKYDKIDALVSRIDYLEKQLGR